jgi:hypothetical protein
MIFAIEYVFLNFPGFCPSGLDAILETAAYSLVHNARPKSRSCDDMVQEFNTLSVVALQK